jgi:hypothetical protein
MTRLFRMTVLVAALMLTSAAQVAAAGNAVRASMTGTPAGVNFDPAAVAERCPADFVGVGAIVQSAGSGELASEAYTGPVTYTDEHCTRPRQAPPDVFAREVTPLLIAAGMMTLATPTGDTLNLEFTNPGVLKGDLTLAGFNRHTFNGPYTITGGTGIFAGASGHGQIGGVAEGEGGPGGIVITLDLHGSLRVPG